MSLKKDNEALNEKQKVMSDEAVKLRRLVDRLRTELEKAQV